METNINSILNIRIEKIKNIEHNIHFLVYSCTAFLIPLMIAHPQLLVGIIVNSALILSAMYLDAKSILPIIILPSLGVLSRGLIFGPFTVYLVYMIPFIWVGNTFLVYCIKYFYLKRKINYVGSLSIAVIAKCSFIFGTAFILVKMNAIPAVFLSAMGLIQVVTALSAGIICYGIVKARSAVKGMV